MELKQQQAFITRKPILDVNHHIVSYQLLAGRVASGSEASASVFATTLAEVAKQKDFEDISRQDLFEDKSIFIMVNANMIDSELQAVFPPEKTVLEFMDYLDLNASGMEICQKLHQLGYKISMRDNPALPMDMDPAVAKCVDYIKIDVTSMPLDEVAARFKNYQFSSKLMIAANVQTLQMFDACKKIGFKLFQGCYFITPLDLSSRAVGQNFTIILKLLDMLSNDADLKRIEDGFKQDPSLTFKLLRYINSAGFGLSCEIQSIRHAITVIGTKQLFKWLTMLMVTAGHNSFSPALMKTSMTRGRFMELLGHNYFAKDGQDNLFIIGVFSLLDVMLNIPMEELLSKVDLPNAISDALLRREGVYGPFLSMVEACEAADHEKLEAIATSLCIDAKELNHCHIASLLWADYHLAQL